MDNKKLINDLVKYIGGKELDSYEEKVEFWKKEFLKKSSLNWSDKIIEAESNFLKSCLDVMPGTRYLLFSSVFKVL